MDMDQPCEADEMVSRYAIQLFAWHWAQIINDGAW